MLELSETDSRLHNLHSVRELDADGDLLADVSHLVGRVLEGILDWIMHLTLLTHPLCFRLDLRIFRRITGHCHGIYPLMRLAVPFVESGIVHPMLRAELLYQSFELYTICLILITSPKVSFSHFMCKTSKLTVYKRGNNTI